MNDNSYKAWAARIQGEDVTLTQANSWGEWRREAAIRELELEACWCCHTRLWPQVWPKTKAERVYVSDTESPNNKAATVCGECFVVCFQEMDFAMGYQFEWQCYKAEKVLA